MERPTHLKTTALKKVSYDPSLFLDVETVEEAMRIIVTPEDGMTSQQRWDGETPILLDLIEKRIDISGSIVLDYGCGIGRLAKPLIEKKCLVIGVDISPNMRALASSLCGDGLMALPPEMLFLIGDQECDCAIAIWSLQHILDARAAIGQIAAKLADGGRLFVVNNHRRVLPSDAGWIDDGVDVRAVLQDYFTEIECGKLPIEIAPGAMRDNTFWAVFQK